ncbi:MaoC/PaaZ C-terminal domain-containing protein [Microbacterium sp.]|uniref:MaoC/PaaZ C-terminal domain-containing protein n=1 Tax=Microbacterium sp. TaxID=51671 RepID=UPI00261520EF|nr:MaoC/PaaZ C-terminal domain-containing protein [Microbacterium sp.]
MRATDWSIGKEIGPLAVKPISRTTLALFAGASGDHNPIHIDTDVARSAGLDDVFAQGMLSMAYLGRLLTDLVPQEQLRRFVVRFTAIIPIHAAPICRGVVREIEERDGERLALLSLTVTLDNETTVLVGEAEIALD